MNDVDAYRGDYPDLSDESWEKVKRLVEEVRSNVERAKDNLEPWEYDQFDAHMREWVRQERAKSRERRQA